MEGLLVVLSIVGAIYVISTEKKSAKDIDRSPDAY